MGEKLEIANVRQLSKQWIGAAPGRDRSAWAALKHHDRLSAARVHAVGSATPLPSGNVSSHTPAQSVTNPDMSAKKKMKNGQRGKAKPLGPQPTRRAASGYVYSHLPGLLNAAHEFATAGTMQGSSRKVGEGGSFVRVTVVVEVIGCPRNSSNGGGRDQPAAGKESAKETFIYSSTSGGTNETRYSEGIKCSWGANKHLTELKSNKDCTCADSVTVMTNADDIACAFPPAKRARREKQPNMGEFAAGLFDESADIDMSVAT